MQKIKQLSIGLLLSISSIVIFLLMAEIVVRILYPELVPSSKYDWSSRHAGYNVDKPTGTFRIIVIGDSYSYGQGVKRSETFPARLEYLLNNPGGQTRFEVVNLGFTGLNTSVELMILDKTGINPQTWDPDPSYRGLAYDPDLIIVEYTLNDSQLEFKQLEEIKQFNERYQRGLRVNNGPYALPIPLEWDGFLTRNSRFYLFSLAKYNQFLTRFNFREDGVRTVLGWYREDFDGWQYTKYALYKMGSIGKDKGIPLVLAVYPNFPPVEFEEYPFKEIHSKVMEVGKRAGFNTIDLLPAFKGLNGGVLRVSAVDGHPNAVAHEIAAKAIMGYLKATGLIPQS